MQPNEFQLIDTCPACTSPVPEESIWFAKGHYYCSEFCAKRGSYLLNPDTPAQIE